MQASAVLPVALPVAGGLAHAAPPEKGIPVGLELYSVRGELSKDSVATVQAVAKMGYQAVEFYAPCFDWTPAFAQDMRKVLDDAGIRCRSTHNNAPSFTADGLKKAAELNRIPGSEFVVMASTGRISSLDGWKALCGRHASEAAEATGGVEYYLIEQEGSRYPELETAERCLENWRKLRA